MITRPATLSDVPQMMALHEAIIRIGGTTTYLTPYEKPAFIANYITPPGTICCHVAEDSEGLIGFQSLGHWPTLPQGWGDIGTYVSPTRQRSGAGAALFAATIAAARAAGITTINAAIRADNAPGLGYYTKRGFVDYEHVPDYTLADGRKVGRVLKRFDL